MAIQENLSWFLRRSIVLGGQHRRDQAYHQQESGHAFFHKNLPSFVPLSYRGQAGQLALAGPTIPIIAETEGKSHPNPGFFDRLFQKKPPSGQNTLPGWG